jgi:glycosyltransferase involved in cell wall biosynthesis
LTTIKVSLVAEQLRRRVPGGIGTYTLGLLKGLDDLPAGERPSLTIVASRSSHGTDPLASLGHRVATSRLSGPLMTRSWDLGLTRVGRGADVVHAVSLATPVPAPGIPLVVTVHDVAWRSMPDAYPARGRRWHEAALRRAVKRAAFVIVPSEATLKALLDAGAGVAEERVRVVGEGADHLDEPNGAAALELLESLGVAGDYLLTVSTLEPRKNLVRLLQAYALARPRLPEDWPLVVVGPRGWGPAGSPAALGSTAGVVFAGPIGNGTLTAVYGGARCCAYVPIVEGFGLPVVEAMSQGTPVVASPVPSSGGASLEVDPTDVSSIADGLVAAACDEATRAALVTTGRARAAQLRWVDAARAHVGIWEQAAQGPTGR